jgi:hypothetical protein
MNYINQLIMKKKLLILSAMLGLSYSVAIAQTNPIPNGTFESWTTSSFESPQNFAGNPNLRAFADNVPFNEVKTTDKYHGTYAIKLTTVITPRVNNGNGNDTIQGYFLNTNPNGNGGPSSWHNGFAYNQKPTGMRGYYKSAVVSPDTALLLVFFYKQGAIIGQYILPIIGTHSTYTLFSHTFMPALTQNPDSVIMGAVSSDFRHSTVNRNGSMLQLDSVSFIGAPTPTQFDGDFETWQTTSIKTPDNWDLSNGKVGGNHGSLITPGVSQTTDAVTGNYAIELTTFLDSTNNGHGGPNHAVARTGAISTGYYPNNCNGNCQEQGGGPFTKQIDTLAFYYKYVPSGSDSGQVSLNFKKNSTSINYKQTNLIASANYQYKEIPFNVGQVPDSVIIDIHSSTWNDTLTSFVGSDLKIDNIHFKSQVPTTPTVTAAGAVLTASAANSNQWYLNGNSIGGATAQTYTVTQSGNYSDIVTVSGISSLTSNTIAIGPATPTIIAVGAVLAATAINGNQWYLNGNSIGGATAQTYTVTQSGNYSDIVTVSGISSLTSNTVTITVPATPTIALSGNAALTSSSATGNQWYLAGNSINGATSQTYTATQNGSYTVKVTTGGISSAFSNTVNVTGLGATVISINTIDNGVYIYPNPNNGIFTIKSPSKILTVEITNTLGTIVLSQTVNADAVAFDLTKEAGGIYIVKVISEQGIINKKIILSH